MITHSSAINQETITNYIIENGRIIFPSRFNFVMDHKGFRPRCLHGLIGTTGGGKSTVTKAFIADLLDADKTVCVWLSEESPVAYQVKIQQAMKYPEKIANIVFVEERNVPHEILKKQKEFFKYVKTFLIVNKFDFFIIDNITTGEFYCDEIGPSGQSDTADFLKGLTSILDTAILWVAHTDRTVSESQIRPITAENVRGSKKIVNVTEYLYSLQKYVTLEKTAFIVAKCLKHRYHELRLHNRYLLVYERGVHRGDIVLSEELQKKMLEVLPKQRR